MTNDDLRAERRNVVMWVLLVLLGTLGALWAFELKDDESQLEAELEQCTRLVNVELAHVERERDLLLNTLLAYGIVVER